MSRSTDRDLLFGLLALQNNFIDRDALVDAFHRRSADAGRPLDAILLECGALAPGLHALLGGLVQEHIRRHGGDPQKSLAALSALGSARDDLARGADPELHASLAHVAAARPGPEHDPDRTVTQSAVGQSTSAGSRFRILRPHAKGGLGQVSVALDQELDRPVALKEIQDRHADDPDSRARFVQEAEITGKLEHPGIIPVYGLGHDATGRPYYAMRFIHGDSLKEAIEQFHGEAGLKGDPAARQARLRELLRRFTDVCNAVAYAHSRGVLHRDLKPGNIMLGPYGETLVVDWGLAKSVGETRSGEGVSGEGSSLRDGPIRFSGQSGSAAETVAGSPMGTPAFASPEQLTGATDRLGPATDIYGLGATLYALLTGRAPIDSGELGEMIRRVERGEVPPVRSIDPAIPRPLEAICRKAMAPRPEDRYATARALAQDVTRWLDDEPVTAWREPVSVRARRWARRHRTGVSGAAAALLAGLIGLAAVAAVQLRANAALAGKNRQLTVANAATLKAKNQAEQALDETTKAKRATDQALAQSEESRRRAEAAEKTARSEAEKAKAINEFLTADLLTQAEPANTAAEDHVTLLEVLDRAAEKVGDRFTGRPEVEEVLRQTIARTYHGLGSWEKAERQWRAVLAAARRRRGSESAEALRALGELAHVLGHRGRIDAEVLGMAKSAHEGLARALGLDHPDTLGTRDNLAAAYVAAGRAAEAITLLQPALKLMESKLGPDHPTTLDSRDTLANAYWSAGRTAEAIPLLVDTLKLRETKLGPDHPDTLISRNNLAVAYRSAGRTAEAIPLLVDTLKLDETKLGPDHPDTLTIRNNLAEAYRDAGRTAEAIKLHEATLKLLESTLGPDHPNTLQSRVNLAKAYRDAGQLDRAVALLKQALQGFRAKVGPDHPSTLGTEQFLADADESLDRFAEAEALRRDALARRRKSTRPDSPLLAGDLAALGRNLLRQSRWSEAEPLLREGLAIREKATPDDWRRYDAMSLLGGSLLGQGRHAEAEPLVVAGYEGMQAREALIAVPGRFRLREAAERVVWLYEAWDQPDRAAAWKARLGLFDLPADVFARP